MKNGLSIDVEEYFHVGFSNNVKYTNYPSRVEKNTYHLLEILSAKNTRATFFMLGYLAERFPALVRDIANEKHEIGLHGYKHCRTGEQTPEHFFETHYQAKAVIEDIAGKQVDGYRAPYFSINQNTKWALEALKSLGFKYDSSIYPIGIGHYNFKNIPKRPFEIIPGFMELPLPVITCAGVNIPFGGGFFLRAYPYCFNRWAIKRYNDKKKAPVIIYLHPWELDPDQPRNQSLKLPGGIRHYLNLDRTESRFRQLISDYAFDSLGSIVDSYRCH